MNAFLNLLRRNPNYRYTWTGQVVSEIGDHFNNIAVFSLALAHTKSGLVVSGVMLSRAVPAIVAGPIAGVLLDRLNRKQVMICSDLLRAILALGFMLAIHERGTWMLYAFSALLMFASPFFSAGRAAILPTITTGEELMVANSLTQTTQWTTLTIGTFLAGASVMQFGYRWAFVLNSVSFLVSAFCISRLRLKPEAFRAQREKSGETTVRPWHDYAEGIRYMRATPLIFAIALIGVGWASGGGAAQILFSLFGDLVFHKGAAGIGIIWGCAGVGLLIGGAFAHWLSRRVGFNGYKRTIVICYIVHGGAYVIFSQMRSFGLALFFIALSRSAIAVSSVLNFSYLLRHVADEFRGRVFATLESMVWSTMTLSMLAAGIASQYYSPRVIGAWAGALSSTTAIFWAWAHVTGRLPDPAGHIAESAAEELEGESALRT
ncbi:MAG: MFS transporter [Acidobacteriota bacterium]|nr:MFS transporter [Acidobacteriota bacterium]